LLSLLVVKCNVIHLKAGWGVAKGNKTSELLLFADIESVTDEVCWTAPRGHQFLEYISSATTFCGGVPELSKGPCNADSGELIILCFLLFKH